MSTITVKTGERIDPTPDGHRRVVTCDVVIGGIAFRADMPNHAAAMRLAVQVARVLGVTAE